MTIEPSEQQMMHQAEQAIERLTKVRNEIGRTIFGQEKIVDLTLASLLSGGHALLIGAPGLAKTKLVATLGKVLNLEAGRIQFTADLMPADIIGAEILDVDDKGKRKLRFEKGPVFCELLMADEINRASPRTQSALLEAMQERQITIGGQCFSLPAPFHVLATQNPIEQEGAYPLPEAQLDRFLMSIHLDYPSVETERKILVETTSQSETEVHNILNADDLPQMQKLVRSMPVGEKLCDQLLRLTRLGRPHDPEAPQLVKEHVAWGPSPRAGQALMLLVRAHALLMGRVTPGVEDLYAVAPSVLLHRMGLQPGAIAQGITPELIVEAMLNADRND